MSTRKSLIRALFLTLFVCQFSVCFAQSGFFVKIDENDLQKSSYNFTYDKANPIADHFTVMNVDKVNDVILNFSGVDAINNNLGQLNFKTNADEQLFMGKWINFTEKSVTLKPLEKKQIEFTITPPADALPGVYVGGISVQGVSQVPSAPGSESTQAFSAKVETRVVEKVYLQMPGTAISQGDVKNFQYGSDSSGRYFTFDIENTGNTLLQAEGNITVEGGYSNTTATLPINIASIQGGDSHETKIPWPNSSDSWGNYQASVDIAIKQFDPFQEKLINLKSVHLDTSMQLIPWNYIGVAAGAIILLVLIIVSFFIQKTLYLKSCEPYIVKEGDTIKTVATDHQMSWQKLAKINKISAPFELKPGSKILVKKLPNQK